MSLEVLSDIQNQLFLCELGIAFEVENGTESLSGAHVWAFYRQVQRILYGEGGGESLR